ncbi:imm11 family protein [Xanthomonas sacchari]|uniref:imm11 family protein n=1 Tax=Xanthomonas sacchari TaxID=56458 RepID=UPI000581D938|nr:DUF1629 domain-containing protein [Xanthomonas sacchari]AJC44789.1 hypothetical protein SB85_02435 [Xanthomonas sacchari]
MNEQTAIPVSIDTDSHQGEFYFLEPSRWNDGIGHGLQFANEAALCRPGMHTVDPPNGDPAQYPERPHLVHVPAEGGLPRDFEVYASIWIVSQALKDVFDAVDAQGFAFAACDFTLADGTPGPQYYLCDVIRELDALDASASRVKVKVEHDFITDQDVQFYSIAGGASLVFKKEVVGGAHIFRQPNSGFDPICDRVMFDALNHATLDGIRLQDASAL